MTGVVAGTPALYVDVVSSDAVCGAFLRLPGVDRVGAEASAPVEGR